MNRFKILNVAFFNFKAICLQLFFTYMHTKNEYLIFSDKLELVTFFLVFLELCFILPLKDKKSLYRSSDTKDYIVFIF